MSVGGRVALLWLLAGALPVAQADEAKQAPGNATTTAEADDEFLEFLGSVDAESADEDWLDYLAQTDIVKVAKAKKTAPTAAEVKKDD